MLPAEFMQLAVLVCAAGLHKILARPALKTGIAHNLLLLF